jgi:hypothetical protein
LLPAVSIFWAADAVSEEYPAVATESNLRAVILGEGKGFSKADLRDMDLNQDGVVDVADLIVYLRSLPPRPNGVNFEVTQSVVKEGDGVVSLTITVSPAYQGDISYVVKGTATAGADYSVLGGTIAVHGHTAVLDITLVDDLILEEVDSLTVTLIPKAGYQIGFAQQHTMFIVDNDAVWEVVYTWVLPWSSHAAARSIKR